MSIGLSRRVYLKLAKSPIRHVLRACRVAQHPRSTRRRALAAQTLSLPSEELNAVNQLKKKGFVQLDSNIIDKTSLIDLAASADKKTQEFHQSEQAQNYKKTFWNYISTPEENASAASPFVKFALQEPVLRMISEYFGEIPLLEYAIVTESIYSEAPPKISQLWHVDRDGTKILKLFVYLTDVNSSKDGPFTLLNMSSSEKVSTGFFMRHSEDDVIFNQVPAQDKVEILAPKLSCFLVDTNHCYHMGSRVSEGHSRLLYTAAFSTYPSLYPWNKGNRIQPVSGLTDLQKKAIGNY